MQQAGEALLAQSLIGQHRHGVAEVQTPGRGDHGQADAAVIVGQAERLRQARRLLAEKQPAPLPEPGLAVVLGGLGGGQPQVCGRLRVLPEQNGLSLKMVTGYAMAKKQTLRLLVKMEKKARLASKK